MSDVKNNNDGKLTLTPRPTLGLKRPAEAGGQMRAAPSHGGRAKTVVVERKPKRLMQGGHEVAAPQPAAPTAPLHNPQLNAPKPAPQPAEPALDDHLSLTNSERAARAKAVEAARKASEESRKVAEIEARRQAEEDARLAAEQAARAAAEPAKPALAAEAAPAPTAAGGAAELPQPAADDSPVTQIAVVTRKPSDNIIMAPKKIEAAVVPPRGVGRVATAEDEDDAPRRAAAGKAAPAKPVTIKRNDQQRRGGRLTVNKAMEEDEGGRQRSLAAYRRHQQRMHKMAGGKGMEAPKKQTRDVVVPETITVQELANRMAERASDVIKSLMKMGMMVTITQSIDQDTAELVVAEFGHNIKRVSDSDVEAGMAGDTDRPEDLLPRPPVVTVMGHVDHGKTSLLDALRATDVAAGEAGGITQHIGAYQVVLPSGQKITFIDTPGHAAFTAMRARGARVTDIVVLVVAADDGIMPQTIEAIAHAKAAGVPIIVAINKMDKPGVNPQRIREMLLQHEVVVESMSGEVQDVEVSALKRLNLDKLEEAILLQSELLELKANPNRPADGIVIEAKLDKGRGPVATVLVKRGTLRVGDVFVAGAEWGKVRALVDERGRSLPEALPAQPVEVLGLSGTPEAGDDFIVVDSEKRAVEITDFRQRSRREKKQALTTRSLENLFSHMQAGEIKELPVVIKADVQGSAEAIAGSLEQLSTDEVAVRVLLSGVGGITESDVTLARASNATIIAFNVRASKQAREMAERDGVEIRYYSIIYDLVDEMKLALGGLLGTHTKETVIGQAEVRDVFVVSKVGKIAGCLVVDGVARRNARARLLRDNVVIFTGNLTSLKRFKDDVKEVRSGTECGIGLENFNDIKAGDVIEMFEEEQIARSL